MSHTFTSHADWSEYFLSTPPATASVISDHHRIAANSTAMPAPATNPDPATFSFNSAPRSANPRVNGVTKPARKRSRASRRTPTTVLSTDTSNFRAMVQQFTGGPSALGIDHPLARRVADHQFAFPSGYSFQFEQQGEQARRMMIEASSNVKHDGGVNSLLY